MKARFYLILSVLALLAGCGGGRKSALTYEDYASTSYSVDGARLLLNANSIFESDRVTLKPEAVSILRALFAQVNREYFTHINIFSHCDDALTEESAQNITSYQAQVIAGYLWFRGIPSSDIEFKGRGFSEPIADLNTPESRYVNQRIEILLS